MSSLEIGKGINAHFIDMERAFAQIKWNTEMEMLKSQTVHQKSRKLIKE